MPTSFLQHETVTGTSPTSPKGNINNLDSTEEWHKIFVHYHEFSSPRWIANWTSRFMGAEGLLVTYHVNSLQSRGILNPSFESNDVWEGFGHSEYYNVSSSSLEAYTGSRSLMIYTDNTGEASVTPSVNQATDFRRLVFPPCSFNFSIYVESFSNKLAGIEAQLTFTISMMRADGQASYFFFYHADENGPWGAPTDNTTNTLVFPFPFYSLKKWLHYSYNLTEAVKQTWANSSSPIYSGCKVDDYRIYSIGLNLHVEPRTHPCKVFFDDVSIGSETPAQIYEYLTQSSQEASIPVIYGEELSAPGTDASTGACVFGLESLYDNRLCPESEWMSSARQPPYNAKFITREFPHGGDLPWSFDNYDSRLVAQLVDAGFDGISPICKADMTLWDSILTRYPMKKFMAIVGLDAHMVYDFNDTSHVHRGNNYIMVYTADYTSSAIIDAILEQHLYNVYGRFTFDNPPLPINLTFGAYQGNQLLGMMGDTISVNGTVELKASISSATELGAVELISNNCTVASWKPTGRTFNLTYGIDFDGYIRLQVDCKNGNHAFTSPIWNKPPSLPSPPPSRPSGEDWYKVTAGVHDMVLGSPEYISSWTREHMGTNAIFSSPHQTYFFPRVQNPSFESNDTWEGFGHTEYHNISSSSLEAYTGSRSLMMCTNNTSSSRLYLSVSQGRTVSFYHPAIPTVLNFSLYVSTLSNVHRETRDETIMVKVRLLRVDGMLCDISFYYVDEGTPIGTPYTWNSSAFPILVFPIRIPEWHKWLHYSYNLTQAIEETWANPNSTLYQGFSIDEYHVQEIMLSLYPEPHTAPCRIFFDDISVTVQSEPQLYRWMEESAAKSPIIYVPGEDLSPATSIVFYGLDNYYDYILDTSDSQIISDARNPPYNAKIVVRKFPNGRHSWPHDQYDPRLVDDLVENGYDGIEPCCRADMTLWDSILTEYPDKRFMAFMGVDAVYLQDFNNTGYDHRGNNYNMVYAMNYTEKGLFDAISKRHFYCVYGRFTYDNPPLPINLTFTAYKGSHFLGMMGDTIHPTGAIRLKATIQSATDIEEVRLIWNNQTLATWRPDAKGYARMPSRRTLEIDYPVLLKGYVRLQVDCENGNHAFTNPIWIETSSNLPYLTSVTGELHSAEWQDSQLNLTMLLSAPNETAQCVLYCADIIPYRILQNSSDSHSWYFNQTQKTLQIVLNRGIWSVQVYFRLLRYNLTIFCFDNEQRPVASLEILLFSATDELLGNCTTDTSGNVTFTRLLPAKYLVHIICRGAEIASRRVNLTDTKLITISCQPYCLVRVFDANRQPLTSACVVVLEKQIAVAQGLTNEEGYVEILLSPSVYDVQVYYQGRQIAYRKAQRFSPGRTLRFYTDVTASPNLNFLLIVVLLVATVSLCLYLFLRARKT